MPTRRTFAAAATLVTAGAIYGSLVPLHFTPLPLDAALAQFRAAPYLFIGPDGRADWVANILLFIPVAYLWMGALTLDSGHRAAQIFAALLLIPALTALAVAIEFTQVWFPPRTVSLNDIAAESLGAMAGTALWMATGQATAEWLRQLMAAREPGGRFIGYLEFYIVGFAIYAALPLDLTLSSGELYGKFRDGRIALVPFADLAVSAEDAYRTVRDFILYIPIGVFLATWRVRSGSRVRPIWMTAALGFLAAGLVECMQVFVLSRFASTTDVVIGGLGATAGAAMMVWLYTGRYGAQSVHSVAPHSRRTLLWLAATGLWAGVVVLIFWAPFEISGSPAEWRERYEGFWVPPFVRLYYSSEFGAISDVLRKLMLFGGFGALCLQTARGLRMPGSLEWTMRLLIVPVATGLLGFGIELGQVLLPPRVPDLTDVILATIGGAIGANVVAGLNPRQLLVERR